MKRHGDALRRCRPGRREPFRLYVLAFCLISVFAMALPFVYLGLAFLGCRLPDYNVVMMVFWVIPASVLLPAILFHLFRG